MPAIDAINGQQLALVQQRSKMGDKREVQGRTDFAIVAVGHDGFVALQLLPVFGLLPGGKRIEGFPG